MSPLPSSSTVPSPVGAAGSTDGRSPARSLAAALWAAARSRPAALSGGLLLLATLSAIAWANSSAQASYHALWAQPVTVGAGPFVLSKPLLLWINDLLMAAFFLLVGLEIKRELFEGALSSARKAALPIAAAVGGVLVPASIYLGVNLALGGDPSGWAVPAATDIAFALGVLALLGSRVPLALKVFLTTVAVVDDLLAVAIIGLFFTHGLSLAALLAAGFVLAALFALNLADVRRPLPYVVLGLVLWLAVLKSGLHATLAGVLLAAAIPLRRSLSASDFAARLRELIGPAEGESSDGLAPDTVANRVRETCDRLESPVVRWEHALQPAILFFVVPVFALANSGVPLSGGASAGAAPVAAGVGLGLLFGKPLGVTLFAWLSVRLGLAELPAGLGWAQLHAASWLAGIGFTMSLFISGLALEGAALEAARLGLLAGSAVAGVLGAALVWRTCAPQPAGAEAPHEPAAALAAKGGDPVPCGA